MECYHYAFGLSWRRESAVCFQAFDQTLGDATNVVGCNQLSSDHLRSEPVAKLLHCDGAESPPCVCGFAMLLCSEWLVFSSWTD